jgi:hypothetical protein
MYGDLPISNLIRRIGSQLKSINACDGYREESADRRRRRWARTAHESHACHEANTVHRTNTDGVIIDPSRSREDDRGIVAWYESHTPTLTITLPRLAIHDDAYRKSVTNY